MNAFSKYMGWVFYNNSFEQVITGIFYGVSYLGFFIFQQLAKKQEVEKILVKVAKITILLIFPLFLIELIFNFPALYMVIIIIAGFLNSIFLFNFLFSNIVIDKDELETGERREALYSAASALIMVPMGNIVAIVGFGILGAFGLTEGVDTWQGQQNLGSVLIGIKILIVFIPIFCGGLIILSQRINPLKGEALVEFKKELLAFHEKKEENFKLLQAKNSRE
jgi:Na+/melibiose symporter-like transporter